MKKGIQKKELIKLISQCMYLREIKHYEKSKIKRILEFFKKNNISNLNNIVLIGRGTHSKVFKIDKFVIKIGLAKIRKEIIESSNVAKDIIRLNIRFITKKITIVVGIVIQAFAEKYENNSEEDLYSLFSSLRKEKLIWTDVKYENVGIINNKVVVIDTDDIFQEKDFNISWSTPLFQLFENKYKNKERISDRNG